MTIRLFLILLLSLILGSCVEEFHPELDEFENLLVVDGAITNEEGPYTVKLSISSGLDIIALKPLTDATVTIVEEDGPSETLIEVEAGTYQTKQNGIQGKVGKKYKLLLSIAGENYESEYELLKEATDMTSVDAQLEYRAFPDAPEEVPGIQFYVNTEPSPYPNDYYLWRMEGTYKYEADLLIYYVFEGVLKEFEDHDAYKICYRTYKIGEINTTSTENLLVPQVIDKPLFFLPAIDDKLNIRYSLLTRQYSVSKEAYDFWHGVEKQSTGSSSLYTTQPYQIRGNLKNINKQDEPVLGYFMAAGVSQKRIFIDKPESITIYLADCGLDYMSYPYIFWTGPSEWPIYVTEGENGANAISGVGCMDCRELGGMLEPPSFWEE